MNNVIFIRFSWKSKTYHAWMERTDGTKRTVIESTASKPWDGSNRPGQSTKNRAHAGVRPLTDRERVARDQPSKAKAQSMGTKKRGQ